MFLGNLSSRSRTVPLVEVSCKTRPGGLEGDAKGRSCENSKQWFNHLNALEWEIVGVSAL